MSDTMYRVLYVMSVIMYVHTCYMQYKTYCGNAVFLHVMSVIMYVHTCYMQYKTYCGNAVFLHVMFSFVVTLHTLTRLIAQPYHTNKTISLANL